MPETQLSKDFGIFRMRDWVGLLGYRVNNYSNHAKDSIH
jgi:hypothetical protein